MREAFQTPFFWLAVSVLVYEIGLYGNRRLRSPLANPLLIATLLLCALVWATNTPLAVYHEGGAFISLFLTPATVALALPIYRKLQTLKAHLLPILLGALAGSLTSLASVTLLCRLFGLSDEVLASLLPKSVTTPIGVEIAAALGGTPALTVIAIIVTGLFGAMALPALLRALHLDHPVVMGVAIGTSAHAVGTARAIELGETEGAMSGLAIGVAGLITALLASFL